MINCQIIVCSKSLLLQIVKKFSLFVHTWWYNIKYSMSLITHTIISLYAHLFHADTTLVVTEIPSSGVSRLLMADNLTRSFRFPENGSHCSIVSVFVKVHI